MIVLGIDPGIAIVGYGVVSYSENNFKVLSCGCITTSSDLGVPNRLEIIYDELLEIISSYEIDAVAIEELFFNKNSKTVIKVAEARGVAILTAVKNKIPIYEYTPLQIKQGVVGYGRAEKKQVQEMVKIILNLNKIPKPDDAADALAVAVCHCHNNNYVELFRA